MLHIGLRQEIQRTCSYRYQTFTSLLRGAARSKPWNGGLGSAGAVMTSLYWNGSTFAPVNKTAAKKEAVVLRQRQPSRLRTQPFSDTAASGICVKTDLLHSSTVTTSLLASGAPRLAAPQASTSVFRHPSRSLCCGRSLSRRCDGQCL